MKVKELGEWLKLFEDQEAEIEVVVHKSDGGYYSQGGYAVTEKFDPMRHITYTDFRGNKFVPKGAPYENSRTLLLGCHND